MKIKNLTVSVLCLAILALSACSSKSSDEPAPVVTQPTSTTRITGLATKGPIAGATVEAFAIRSDVTDTVPLGTAKTDGKGNYTIQTFGYTGPVVVKVTGGAYNDEISGAQVTLKTPLRTMFSSVGTGTTTIVVSPLTELAAKEAEGQPVLSVDAIDAANRDIATFFGCTNITSALPNKSSTDANQTGYATALSTFSQMVIDSMRVGDLAAGQSMDDALATVMTTLGGELQQNGGFSTTSLAAINLAKNLILLSGGTTAPPSATPPPPTPAHGVAKYSATGTTGPILEIDLTVTLPAGVTVDIGTAGDAAGVSVNLAGGAALSKTATLRAIVTQASGTVPGKIDIVAFDKGLPAGQFLVINFNVDTTGAFPLIADFAPSAVAVKTTKLVALDGITISASSLVGL